MENILDSTLTAQTGFPCQPPKPQPATLTCSVCGNIGTDVEVTYLHIGGESPDQPITQCINRRECWERWDKAWTFYAKAMNNKER
jgi:hypothetical protein